MAFDYRRMLQEYMSNVVFMEGVDFLEIFEDPEEQAEARRLLDEALSNDRKEGPATKKDLDKD